MKKTRSKSPVKKPASAKKRVSKNPTSNDVANESPTRAPEIDLEQIEDGFKSDMKETEFLDRTQEVLDELK